MLAALYAVSIAVLTIYGGNLLWLAVRHARGDALRAGPVPEPNALPPAPREWPSVTIQIPLFNEPLVVERVIDACARLRYPHGDLGLQVLDDSTDATVERAASRVDYWRRRGVDVVHIRREVREGYKAGALQNGLRLSRGDFVAIFDADFLPEPDFLLRTIPMFTSDEIGVVQARWGHLNQDVSLLTFLQSMGLDAHFTVEQDVRCRQGCYMNFNGTAGVWRRACIEDAGGWNGDTIAEDLDLSYRAQMRGWRFRYLHDVDVPAELPSLMSALRSQQFRWAKGSVEAARKLLPQLLRSHAPRHTKIQGALHLTAHFVFPFILLATLVHAPLMVSAARGAGPGTAFFGWMSLGLVGFAGFVLVHILAQRALYPDWGRRILGFPLYMAGTIGLSVQNTRAVLEAVAGKRTGFVRTPKLNQVGTSDSARHAGGRSAPHAGGRSAPNAAGGSAEDRLSVEERRSTAASRVRTAGGERPATSAKSSDHHGMPPIAWVELGIFAYSLAGLAAVAVAGEWAAVPFQATFAGGFGMVAAETFREVRRNAAGPGTSLDQ